MKTQEEEKKKTRKKKVKEKQEQEEQDGFSEHSPEQRLPLSSASSLPKSDQQEDHSQVELELKLLEALEIYPPSRLQGIHRHFVLYGMMEYLKKRFDRHFSADEILQLLDRFFNLEMMKTDDDDTETFNQEVGFSLPQGFLVKEEQ